MPQFELYRPRRELLELFVAALLDRPLPLSLGQLSRMMDEFDLVVGPPDFDGFGRILPDGLGFRGSYHLTSGTPDYLAMRLAVARPREARRDLEFVDQVISNRMPLVEGDRNSREWARDGVRVVAEAIHGVLSLEISRPVRSRSEGRRTDGITASEERPD